MLNIAQNALWQYVKDMKEICTGYEKNLYKLCVEGNMHFVMNGPLIVDDSINGCANHWRERIAKNVLNTVQNAKMQYVKHVEKIGTVQDVRDNFVISV